MVHLQVVVVQGQDVVYSVVEAHCQVVQAHCQVVEVHYRVVEDRYQVVKLGGCQVVGLLHQAETHN